MRCESCRNGDPQCNSWEHCDASSADRMTHHADEAVRHADRLVELLAVGPRFCRCGGLLSTVLGLDEDDGDQAEVLAVAECAVCGRERRTAPMGPAEVRTWVRWRRNLLTQQRKAAS